MDQTNLKAHSSKQIIQHKCQHDRGSKSLLSHIKFQEVRDILSTWIKDILECHKATLE